MMKEYNASPQEVVSTMVVILSSYIAIALGGILLIAGYIARRQQSEYSRYLLGGGGVFVVLGLLGLLWFMMAFN